MENLIALSPIIIMLFLALVLILVIAYVAKRLNNSGHNSKAQERIRALEEENNKLRNKQSNK